MRVSEMIRSMELSGVAYQDIQPRPKKGDLYVISDPNTDVQCYLRKYGGTLSVTFRGSNSARDWRTNLTFKRKIVPYGNTGSKIRVHSGFLEAYKSPAVRNTIHGFMTDDIVEVKITGHSQGAALAILCGVDLQFNYPERDYEVLLFGSPRVGNRAFQKSYNKRVFKTLRFENGNDIVTKVPFAIMGYRHVGAAIHIGRPRVPGLFTFKTHYPQMYYKSLINGFLREN